MILYEEMTVRTNNLSKVTRYKLSIEVVWLLRNDNEQSEKEYNSIYVYLGLNVMNEVKDLHTENYKMLLKEIKEGINKWKGSLCWWTGGPNIFKMSILSKAI